MRYTLPSLPYEYWALEPYFDERTMRIHHTKHHQNYIHNTNNVLKDFPELVKLDIDDLIQNLDQVPYDKRIFLRNNAGGHANHSMFWKILKIGTKLNGKLKFAIERDFSSVENFKEDFEKAASSQFGSGWVWLILKSDKKLKVVATTNQNHPLMGEDAVSTFGYPIIGLDVWEHAYYLQYENRRNEYIKAFWSVVNWDEATQRFEGKLI